MNLFSPFDWNPFSDDIEKALYALLFQIPDPFDRPGPYSAIVLYGENKRVDS